jgi:hypothetical protein
MARSSNPLTLDEQTAWSWATTTTAAHPQLVQYVNTNVEQLEDLNNTSNFIARNDVWLTSVNPELFEGKHLLSSNPTNLSPTNHQMMMMDLPNSIQPRKTTTTTTDQLNWLTYTHQVADQLRQQQAAVNFTTAISLNNNHLQLPLSSIQDQVAVQHVGHQQLYSILDPPPPPPPLVLPTDLITQSMSQSTILDNIIQNTNNNSNNQSVSQSTILDNIIQNTNNNSNNQSVSQSTILDNIIQNTNNNSNSNNLSVQSTGYDNSGSTNQRLPEILSNNIDLNNNEKQTQRQQKFPNLDSPGAIEETIQEVIDQVMSDPTLKPRSTSRSYKAKHTAVHSLLDKSKKQALSILADQAFANRPPPPPLPKAPKRKRNVKNLKLIMPPDPLNPDSAVVVLPVARPTSLELKITPKKLVKPKPKLNPDTAISSGFCSICKRQYNSKKTLRQHVYDRHSNRNCTCPVCNYTFTTLSSFTKHMKTAHKQK